MKKDSENSIRILNNIVNGLYSSTVTNQPDALPLNTKEKVLRVAVGSDHGGFEAKEKLKVFLKELGYRVTDVGTYNTESVDYPDFALKVALKVKSGDCERGIMIDGAGIGSSMVCNKVRGIRAALCYDLKTIVNSREHNDANILSFGARFVSIAEAQEAVALWLSTPFQEEERHVRRIAQIDNA